MRFQKNPKKLEEWDKKKKKIIAVAQYFCDYIIDQILLSYNPTYSKEI